MITVGPLRGDITVNGRIAEIRKDSYMKIYGIGEGVNSGLEFSLELWITGTGQESKIEWNFRGDLSGIASLLGERTVDWIASMIVEEIIEGIKKELQ